MFGNRLYLVIVDRSSVDLKINDDFEICDIKWYSIDEIMKMWDQCNALIKHFILSRKYKYHIFSEN